MFLTCLKSTVAVRMRAFEKSFKYMDEKGKGSILSL